MRYTIWCAAQWICLCKILVFMSILLINFNIYRKFIFNMEQHLIKDEPIIWYQQTQVYYKTLHKGGKLFKVVIHCAPNVIVMSHWLEFNYFFLLCIIHNMCAFLLFVNYQRNHILIIWYNYWSYLHSVLFHLWRHSPCFDAVLKIQRGGSLGLVIWKMSSMIQNLHQS